MMKQILFSGVIGLFLTLVGTPLLIKLLARKGYGQYIRDDGPREHAADRGKPTLGGIAFILARGAARASTPRPAARRPWAASPSSWRRSPPTSCPRSSPATPRPTRVCWCSA